MGDGDYKGSRVRGFKGSSEKTVQCSMFYVSMMVDRCIAMHYNEI
jgi:hypothetical protein